MSLIYTPNNKITKTITSAYTTTDEDNDCRIICNSATDFTITLHSPTGRYNFDLEIDNKGIGVVTVGGKELTQDTHAHVGNNNGTEWVVSLGGGGSAESAYDTAVEGGYSGTEEEFKVDLASIEGLADAIISIVGGL